MHSMWFYRNLPVKMITKPFHFFQNLDDAAYKLRVSKYWLHKAIMDGVILDNISALLVYMDIVSGQMIPNHVATSNNYQRRIPEDSTGKKRRRREGDDSNCKLRKTQL